MFYKYYTTTGIDAPRETTQNADAHACAMYIRIKIYEHGAPAHDSCVAHGPSLLNAAASAGRPLATTCRAASLYGGRIPPVSVDSRWCVN